jgi:uncharacterized membrane protein YhaH (DUF805 family)
MTFFDSIRTCVFNKFATFKGVASKSEFAWFMVFYIAFYLIGSQFLYAILNFIFGTQTTRTYTKSTAFIVDLLLIFLFTPLVSASVRRLHAVGKNAYSLLIFLPPWFVLSSLLWLPAGFWPFDNWSPGEMISAQDFIIIVAFISTYVVSLGIFFYWTICKRSVN